MNALDLIAGRQLKLMLVGGAAIVFAGLYGSLWLGKAASEKDRGLIVASFENVCASVGVPYRLDAAGEPLKRSAWGKDCAAKILKLATDAAGAATVAVDTYVAHDADQAAKGVTYRAAARRSAQRIQSGQQQMETAIDHSQDGHLGPDYFDGLNRALGLRPYVGASSPGSSGSDHAEGQADAGSAGL